MDFTDFTEKNVHAMQNVEIKTTGQETLRDMRDVHLRMDLPEPERFADFVRQIGNPYCYRHGKYTVKISFSDTDVTLEDRLLAYIRQRYSEL